MRKTDRRGKCPLSILMGSINPYSYLGHSQRMFSLASHYASLGMKITWMNPPSFGFPRNRSLIKSSHVSRSLKLPFLVTNDEVAKHVVIPVYDSWAPPKYDSLAGPLFAMRFLQTIYAAILSGIEEFDVFFFDSPVFADLAAALKKAQGTIIVYDSPDDYSAYSEIGAAFKKLEEKAVGTADFVVTPTLSVKRELLRRNRGKVDVRVIPNGVPKSEIAKSPSIKVRRGKPRIGFIGTIASWVDIGLVFTVAEKMPDCEFVLAGDGPNYRFWRQNPPTNVCFVGRVPMAKRGEFVSSLDVGLIPFKRVSLADSAYPLKLLEYFARGVPVVSSPLVETKRIADGLAYFADGVDAWTAQINKALTDSFARRLSYIDFARKHTWENTARTLLEIIAEKSTVRAVCTC